MSHTAALYQRLSHPDAAPADRAEALSRLGDLHRLRGELGAAEAAYEAAWSLDPRGEAAEGRGLVALMKGEAAGPWFERARAAFSEAGQVERAANAEANLGSALLMLGQREAAEAHLRRAMAARVEAGLAPEPLALCNLGRCLEARGEPARALERYEEARALGAVGVAGLLAGRLLRRLERSEEAADAYVAALSALPSGVERGRAAVELGALRHEAGDLAGAIEAWRRGAAALRGEGAPRELATALVSQGGALYLHGDPRGARRALEEAAGLLDAGALDRHPLGRRLLRNRGLVRVALGDADGALADLERALGAAERPEEEVALCSALVDLHRLRGDMDQAMAVQARVAALEADHGLRGAETGMLYTAVEDRSLNLSVAEMRQAGPAPRRGPVLLVAPPAYGATGPLFPRGAASVASYLQAHGVPARVLPLAAWVEPSDDELAQQARMRQVLGDALAAYRPRAVGLSVTFSYLYPRGQRVAEILRELDPELPLIIGGPHVTYQDVACLEETPALDAVVRGEGEWAALELIEALDAGAPLDEIAGVTWRAPDGSIRRNPRRKLGDVLELPPVDFSLLPADFNHRMDITALTSRGCAFRCRFCHEFRYWGGVVREHPVSRVIDEMERLAAYGNRLQGIDDSMLDMRSPFFMELVKALGRSDHVSENFGLLTRLDTINREGAEAMADAGLRWVMMGAESGSQVVLDAMNKGLKVDQIAQGLEVARAAGLSTSAFFIIGHPGDDPAQSQVTLDFVDGLLRRDLLGWLDLSTFTPYPGTPFYNQPDRHGVRILTRDWALWRRTNRPVAELDTYPASEIYLGLLRMLDVQDRHLKARREGLPPPPQLGSGSAAG